ncbi:MAG: tetraether lipid synthase Tes [Candidatus Hadarchaeota archaeon]
MKELAKTGSICPECLKILPATIFERDGKVWIKKTCNEHGEFEDLYSGSYEWYKRAEGYARDGKGVENPQIEKDAIVCPKDCGLCTLHLSHTALANVVLTNRCDLTCWYCFFYAGRVGYVYEPSMEDIDKMMKILKSERPIPCNALQLTGGEPTLRKDLIDIIKLARSYGFDHIQLNTDGVKLSGDAELVRRVRDAGVNTLYLSFDGVTEKTNPKNHWEIPQAIENARNAGLGVVLVPTVINSVNDHEVGDILKYGFKNMDVIRGVNFQPVSLVGRMPKEERERYRITIPDVIKRIEEQTNGEITMNDFFSVPAAMTISEFVEALTGKPMYDLSSHFACGAATYVFEDDGRLVPLTRFIDVEGLLEYLGEKTQELKGGKSKLLVGTKLLYNIGKFIDKKKKPKNLDVDKIIFNAFVKHDYGAVGQFHMKSLFIGMMHFMDLYNYDIERVKRCCIHYTMTDSRVIPFCAFNVIPEWYRDKGQKDQGISFEEWEAQVGRKMKDDLYKRDVEKLKATEAYRKFTSQIEEIKAGR